VDLLLELLLEFFGELLLQVFAEIAVAFIWRTFGKVVEAERIKNTFVSVVTYVFLGSLTGGISLAIFPHPLVRATRFHGISLLISPIATGSMMALIGSVLRRNNRKVVPIESFGYASAFAFGMALVRLVLVK